MPHPDETFMDEDTYHYDPGDEWDGDTDEWGEDTDPAPVVFYEEEQPQYPEEVAAAPCCAHCPPGSTEHVVRL